MSEIVIAPIHKTLFTGRNWQGLDLNLLANYIRKSAPGVNVRVVSIESVLDVLDTVPAHSYLLYTPSYDSLYRKYIADIIFHIAQCRPDIHLVPNLDMLAAFENKGYQELLKKRLRILNLKGHYFGDISDFPKEKFTDFPYVVKIPTGATSSGVHLANDFNSLISFLKARYPASLRLRMKRLLKKYLVKDRAYLTSHPFAAENYDKFFSQRTPFIIQEFIEGLNCDYRVTAFGSKYYSFRRFVRDNDFRASGSGNFVFEEPPHEVLDFAKEVMDKLGVPLASLDIAQKGNECFLIEFQGIGFGPSAVQKSSGYYIQTSSRNGSRWIFCKEPSNLERAYADALVEFMQKENERVEKIKEI